MEDGGKKSCGRSRVGGKSWLRPKVVASPRSVPPSKSGSRSLSGGRRDKPGELPPLSWLSLCKLSKKFFCAFNSLVSWSKSWFMPLLEGRPRESFGPFRTSQMDA